MGIKVVNGGERFHVNFSPVADGIYMEQVTHIRYPVFGGWIVWQDDGCSGMDDSKSLYKSKVANNGNGGMTFVPDPNHEWTLEDD